ncbi:MAG: DUF3086 domain-containing protein [Elainellaceae cyanobacterium]
MDEETNLSQRLDDLRREEQRLTREIVSLKQTHEKILKDQSQETQVLVSRLLKEGLSELEQRKKALQLSVEQLERRQERIREEMRTNFAGASQDLAVRLQGFKDYLVGSLQDLSTAAEQIELSPKIVAPPQPISIPRSGELRDAPSRGGEPLEIAPKRSKASRRPPLEAIPQPLPPAPASASGKPQMGQPQTGNPQLGKPQLQFAEQPFEDEVQRIRQILDQYRMMPDYYGPPWQLRRTFEPIHADRIGQWFFEQGGRGALRTLGSRLQNILVASAAISVLRTLYGDRVRALVLGDTPERLGEWRRGLQDCLGISRADFGSQEGVVLFEAPEAVAQRADRLIDQEQLPVIIVDEAEEAVSLAILQFPLWLAFAPDPKDPIITY